ncbi:SLC13 family permease [Natrialbaceae archaeon GCM10025810]|uniref:SLC13 family permease n=1 Tax=Halovalidus salilacus TaxID=3075124 RepID=UPI00360BC460
MQFGPFIAGTTAVPDLEVLVVFALVAVTLVLFVTEPVPVDVTAIGLLVTLVVLGDWTGVSPEDGVSGFASPATITVLAMFMLSEGVRRTGVIQLLSDRVGEYTAGSESRTLAATLGIAGPTAGFVNNTPVVAIMLPVVRDLARRANTSPSKLLIPLSFASMLGGTLTLVGTSSNILASDVYAALGGERFGMFEFTGLGVVVLVVGCLYLLTVGRYLTPARIPADDDIAAEFGVAEYLTDVVVREGSPLVGRTIRELRRDDDVEFDVYELVRGRRSITRALGRERVRAGDVLAVRADRDALADLLEADYLDVLPASDLDPEMEAGAASDRPVVGSEPASETDPLSAGAAANGGETDLESVPADDRSSLVELVLLRGSPLIGQTIESAGIRRRFDVTVVAIRRGDSVVRRRMREIRLRPGDALLVQASDRALERLTAEHERTLVVNERRIEEYERSKIPVAIGIVAGVVGLAALDLLAIHVAALGGVVAMIVAGVLAPDEAYGAVSWDVVFLLAGVIPLGVAMDETGAAEYLAGSLVVSAEVLPVVAVVGLFYVVTAILTNVVSNNAAVILLIPVAMDVATRVGADPFPFVMAVTFAASAALLTPVGYQTNLMVYGPGGYRFSDFARVGAPLQALLAVVTTLCIVHFWPP